ncbi:MAG: c-type cytochrome [Gemmatimonadetes bacterium]|nr:c-type cytochrome [Gemmatimonadota bacterium]
MRRLGAGVLMLVVASAGQAQSIGEMDGRTLYQRACASCHGEDGAGAPAERRAFEVPVPDFTNCSFASREPDADWIAVAHEGGPVRGFDPTMPAFGDAFDEATLQRVMDYMRTMCGDPSWPRGELNLPRAFFTEKAYPEDEAVSTVTAALEGTTSVMNELLYERRFGPRTQWEIAVPFGVRGAITPGGSSEFGLGDVEIALKHAVWHSLEAGSILSVGSEVLLPTGDDDAGFGKGAVVIEPYISFGRIVATDGFVQAQVLAEISTNEAKAEHELGWRVTAGRTFTEGRFGRTWTPMLEVLGAHELESGGGTAWDLVPQLQVSLNTRQHVLLNVGARIPATDGAARATQLMVYVLWDWFDGGLFDGW